MNFEIGQKITISALDGRKETTRYSRKAKVVYIGEKYITVDFGKYREAFLICDLKNGGLEERLV